MTSGSEVKRKTAEKMLPDHSAALARVLSAGLWEPIATAPKPFIDFLGYFSNGEQHVVAISSGGECYRELDPDESKWMMPTHWQPLPAPPSQEQPHAQG